MSEHESDNEVLKGSCLCGSVAYEIRGGVGNLNHCHCYRSSGDVDRSFCSVCGSNLQFIRDERAGFALAVGTLDDDPIRRPTAQINTAYKAPWWDLHEPPPCFDTYPSQQKD